MKKFLVILISMTFLSSVSLPVEAATIKAGAVCKTLGKTSVVGKRTYICVKTSTTSTKKVWAISKVTSTKPEPTDPEPTDPAITLPIPSTLTKNYPSITPEQNAHDLFGLRTLHTEGIDGTGVTVAVIDTAVERSHPNFANMEVICVGAINTQLEFGEHPCTPNAPDNSHGQGVLGTLTGAYGVAPELKVIAIDLDRNFFGDPDYANIPLEKQSIFVAALRWVNDNYIKYNISVLSVSVGEYWGDRNNVMCGQVVPKGFQQEIYRIQKADLAVMWAAANSFSTNWIREPGCEPGVIMVGATAAWDPYGVIGYSSISKNIDIVAPCNFTSTDTNNGNMGFGGTSQATPFAAGVIALGKQVRPDLNMAQLFYYLKQSAYPVDDYEVKGIPLVQPVEFVKLLKSVSDPVKLDFISQIQVKSN